MIEQITGPLSASQVENLINTLLARSRTTITSTRENITDSVLQAIRPEQPKPRRRNSQRSATCTEPNAQPIPANETSLLDLLERNDQTQIQVLAKRELMSHIHQAAQAIESYSKVNAIFDTYEACTMFLAIITCLFNRNRVTSPALQALVQNLPKVFNNLYCPAAIIALINQAKLLGLIDPTPSNQTYYSELLQVVPQIVNKSSEN